LSPELFAFVVVVGDDIEGFVVSPALARSRASNSAAILFA